MLLVSYLVQPPASVETTMIVEWPVTVVCLIYTFFECICARAYLFLDVVLNSHMGDKSYQEIAFETNCATDPSVEEKV